jgi:hypothetical protein
VVVVASASACSNSIDRLDRDKKWKPLQDGRLPHWTGIVQEEEFSSKTKQTAAATCQNQRVSEGVSDMHMQSSCYSYIPLPFGVGMDACANAEEEEPLTPLHLLHRHYSFDRKGRKE